MSKIHNADEFSMVELLALIEADLEIKNESRCMALNPDLFPNEYSGNEVIYAGKSRRCLSLKAWLDLAEVCTAQLAIPEVREECIVLKFNRLSQDDSWHHKSTEGREKYGIESDYANIQKIFEPHFVKDYFEALNRCSLSKNSRVLNLGINRGDEFDLLDELDRFKSLNLHLVGLDHSLTSLKFKNSQVSKNHKISSICADVERMPFQDSMKFDLLISINTLHSPKFDGKSTFRHVFQNLLKPEASILLGFPNCRYVNGEVIYGGKTKNYARHEFSLLLKDLQYYKKYLQSHKKRVTISGKYTLLLMGTPI